VCCVTWPIFLNFGIPSISLECVSLETSNLVCGFTAWPTECADWAQGPQTPKRKTRSIGAFSALRDLLFKFWDTLYISGMGISRDFKFGVRIHGVAYKPKKRKKSKGGGLRHATIFLNFGTPSIFLEWVQLETSYLVCGFNAWPTNQKMQK